MGAFSRKSPMKAGKNLALATLACVLCATAVDAASWARLPAPRVVVEVDWQSPQMLPRRFRNHCVLDADPSRSYCSNHCGFDYQFFAARAARSVAAGSASAIATGTDCCAVTRDLRTRRKLAAQPGVFYRPSARLRSPKEDFVSDTSRFDTKVRFQCE